MHSSAMFLQIVRSIGVAGGDWLAAREVAEADRYCLPETRRAVEKAAVAAGTSTDADWASRLVDFRDAASGFFDALRSESVFDRLYSDGAFRRGPINSRFRVWTGRVAGRSVAEGAAKPLSAATVFAGELAARKASAIVVMTTELLRNASLGSDGFLSRALQQGVAGATDQSFLGELLAGTTPTPSAGSDAAAVLADVGALLQAVNSTGSGRQRLYLVCDPITANQLTTLTGTDGRPAFPGVGPTGGELCNVTLLVSEELGRDSDGGTLLLVDAAQVYANRGTVVPSASTQGTIQLDDQPGVGADAVPTSLFQNNLVALRAERIFGFELARASAVAAISGVDYAGS